MKRILLISLVMVFALATGAPVFAGKLFTGSETDLYKIPIDTPNVIFNVTKDKVTCKIRIWGMTDGEGKEVKDLSAMIGKTVVVHSKYLNEITHGDNSMIAREVVDADGYITFTKNNPATKIGHGKPFRIRYTMSVPEDDMWAYVPLCEYQYLDSKGNPGIEAIITDSQAYVVPEHFAKDEVDLYGVLPSKIYDPQQLRTGKIGEYK